MLRQPGVIQIIVLFRKQSVQYTLRLLVQNVFAHKPVCQK